MEGNNFDASPCQQVGGALGVAGVDQAAVGYQQGAVEPKFGSKGAQPVDGALSKDHPSAGLELKRTHGSLLQCRKPECS